MTVSFQTKVAIGIILTSVLVLSLVLYLTTLDENDWIGIKQNQHPPTVAITREGSTVMIRWYGGWDQQFIDHVRVCTSLGPCRDYAKPKPGYYITIPVLGDDDVQVEVFGYDLAGQFYRPIANVTV